jgi:hypothetical protein
MSKIRKERLEQGVPPWLADLSEALGGRRITVRGETQNVAPEKLQAMKQSLLATDATDFYSCWARWFFVERFQEPVKTFSP